MPKIVTIRLTLAEARAVSLTMSNHVDAGDHQGQLSLYLNQRSINAAHRAHARISQAIRDATITKA